MGDFGLIGILLLIANTLVTYKGFKDVIFFQEHLFKTNRILVEKEYKRLISSGFLHVNWWHFGFNMFTLYMFSSALEQKVGLIPFIVIYFVSLIGGNLFSLWVHKNHENYSAVGASGAVSGLVFASIALFPGMKLGLLLIPISIPGWLFGILYTLYTIYGIKSQKDNIGHEAHLGGGIVGMLTSICFMPSVIQYNYLPILAIFLPASIFIFIIIQRPYYLLIDNPYAKKTRKLDVDEQYHEDKIKKQVEIDILLDKISQKGIDKLSDKERKKLDELSK